MEQSQQRTLLSSSETVSQEQEGAFKVQIKQTMKFECERVAKKTDGKRNINKRNSALAQRVEICVLPPKLLVQQLPKQGPAGE